MTTAEILRAARARIATPDRWGQGMYFYEGRRCAAGALFHDTDRIDGIVHLLKNCPAYQVLQRVVAPTRVLDIEGWNDAPERQHSEVLEAFDAAIALALAELGAT